MPRTTGFKIRLANPGDVYDIAQLSNQVAKETGLKDRFGFDWEVTIATIKKLIEGDNYLFLVAESDNNIVAYLSAILIPVYFSPNFVESIKLSWYIQPDYSSLGISSALMKAHEDWAKSKGARSCRMTTLETDRKSLIEGLYEKSGYEIFETSYIKELK